MNGEDYFTRTFDLGVAIQSVRRSLPKIVPAGLIVGALAAGYLFLFPGEYAARCSFLPVAGNSQSGPAELVRSLMGSAAGAGLAIAGGMFGGSEVYPTLLTSNRLITAVLNTVPSAPEYSGKGTYRSILGYPEQDLRTQHRAIEHVRSRLKVSVSRGDGVVTLTFQDKDARLAATFLADMLKCVEQFNLVERQSQAQSVRVFLDERLKQSKMELGTAEENLLQFRMRNVRYENSAKLALEEARLSRQVRLSESVYQILQQQYEYARVDEARDTPTVTLIDPPMVPAERSGLGVLGGFTLFGMLGSLPVALWAARPALMTQTANGNDG